MMWWFLVGGLAIAVSGILFSAFRLRLQSVSPQLQASWGWLASGKLVHENEWRLQWRILFIQKQIPLAAMANRKRRKQHKPHKRRQTNWTWTRTMRMLRALHVDHWELTFDSGDQAFNALLYPLNYYPACRGHLDINFEGRQFARLDVHSSIWLVLLAWIRSRKS